MGGIAAYSTTPGSNTTLNGIGVSDSSPPDTVDNMVRQLMADIRDAFDDIGGAATSAGTDTVTLTTGQTLTAYADGYRLTFIAGGTNTGATTLNVDSVGAKAVVKGDGSATALAAGDITAGMPVDVVYDASVGSGSWLLMNPKSGLSSYISNVVEDTTPQLGGQLDVNGKALGDGTRELLTFTEDASAVNHVNIENQATGGGPIVRSAGDDTNVDLLLGAKGSGQIKTESGINVNLEDKQLIRANLKDYGEITNAIGSIGGGTQDIDLTAGNVVSGTVDTSTTTFTFSNPTASDEGCSFTLVLTNGGSQTVNWPASVDWAGGAAPSLTASGVDILEFFTINGGTIWYGFAAGLDMQ